MEEEPKPKVTRKKAAPKVVRSVEKLVLHALTLAASNPRAKWTGTTVTALFPNKEPHVEAAIKLCLDANRPLLKQVGLGGALTSAGFEQVAGGVAPEQVGPLAKTVLETIPLDEREAFITDAISRTPQAATELTPLLADIIAAAKAEHEVKIAAAMKQKQDHDTAIAALVRAQHLLAGSLQSKRDALRRQYEALGGDPTELYAADVVPKRKSEQPDAEHEPPVPQTEAGKEFRRYTADRLAAAWRDAWNAKKDEGRDYLETAIWNIRGMKMIGEVGAKVAFDGRRHESDAPVFTDDAAKVVRPGWLLHVDDEEYVALKAAVAKA